ncbi:MAG: ribonuclease E/G [Betaproteobacteria bacterium HGW-Betaproteobacteria-8]|nr:MAG: ribonuclease E/G [Betaproteobacteria bacterium HGW-Betaproteobacteria-8]
MKRMLFNATQSEELRVAIVDGQKLIDLDIETAGKEQCKSNIYKGVITRIEPSLEAAFVNYGTDRHGFLPFKEVARSYFLKEVEGGRARIQDVLKEGQELIVQVDKDERGNKGAALTTFISLAGRYLVLMPNNPRGGGVSRRIEGEDRNELRDTMAQLEVPNGMSIIARTAGIGRSLEELQWDLNYLLQLWTAIEGASTIQAGAFLIYQEGSLVIRAIRDYFQPDIGEILIDTPDIHEQAVQFMNHVMPGNVARVKLYQDEIPLFSRFQIEHQIETAFSREVRLPSGGAIVIDHTEALVSIDVNSGRSTKGADIEQTAFNTNLEAAEEVARQLRLRDLGGLVVIDFIDMESQRNQREVENRLRDALHYDRARVQTGKISRFGLLELSRQRLRPSLGESNHMPCPRCHGTGHIRGIESTALHILRITQEEAMKENSALIQVQLPVEAATFLLNEKRADIHKIEQRMGVEVVLIPNIHMETPNYTITRVRTDDVTEEVGRASYQMVELPNEEEALSTKQEPKPVKAEAAVKGITPASPAPTSKSPVPKTRKTPGVVGRILGWLGLGEKKESDSTEFSQRRDAGRGNRRTRNGRSGRNAERGERQQGNAGADRSASAAAGSGERSNRQPQRPQQANRNERADRTQAERPQTEPKPALATATPEGGEQRSRRSRGNRRDRGPRGENAQRENVQQQAQATASSAEAAASKEAIEVTKAPVTAPAAEIVTSKAVAEAAPVEVTLTAQPAIEAKVEAAPKAAKPAKEEKAKPAETTEVKTKAVETKAVETKSSAETKTEAVEAPVAEKAEKKSRAPRRRKPAEDKPVDLTASGLQLVETKGEPVKVEKAAEATPAKPKTRKPAAWQQKGTEQAQEEPLVIVQTQK